MTKEELCIHACKYAIGELTRKGSSAFITSAHEGRRQITWVEVMEWLNREQEHEDAISRYGVLYKIAEFFSNWDGDETAKMEISVNDMREIADIFRKKARAEWRLNKIRQEQQPKTGHCKDCKYFEYDSVAKVDGVPLIVAHEICNKWGGGCKTKEDGYCFLFESQESEDKK